MSRYIPKKRSEFVVQADPNTDPYAWGIEADYMLSYWLLSIYHLIPLLLAFFFWVYWLMHHPGDWQNASVPVVTVIALIAVIWLPFGSTFNSHPRVGQR
jgi:hypothetical protein